MNIQTNGVRKTSLLELKCSNFEIIVKKIILYTEKISVLALIICIKSRQNHGAKQSKISLVIFKLKYQHEFILFSFKSKMMILGIAILAITHDCISTIYLH